jgi:hypothetical protein
MATRTVKATYSLDEESTRTLEGLARRLGVSKSEALRRAIRQMARLDLDPGEAEVAALDELQQKLGLTPSKADEWASRVRRERLASSRL